MRDLDHHRNISFCHRYAILRKERRVFAGSKILGATSAGIVRHLHDAGRCLGRLRCEDYRGSSIIVRWHLRNIQRRDPQGRTLSDRNPRGIGPLNLLPFLLNTNLFHFNSLFHPHLLLQLTPLLPHNLHLLGIKNIPIHPALPSLSATHLLILPSNNPPSPLHLVLSTPNSRHPCNAPLKISPFSSTLPPGFRANICSSLDPGGGGTGHSDALYTSSAICRRADAACTAGRCCSRCIERRIRRVRMGGVGRRSWKRSKGGRERRRGAGGEGGGCEGVRLGCGNGKRGWCGGFRIGLGGRCWWGRRLGRNGMAGRRRCRGSGRSGRGGMGGRTWCWRGRRRRWCGLFEALVVGEVRWGNEARWRGRGREKGTGRGWEMTWCCG
ncbi:MAG: hypothetical protein FRX48_07906 [Lasallia pustulata]|uniref:Uncharacterized protein n=1 Tax=Lasallia pustulata TaxID=136370 RepID=A0A5M8PHB1_9LECA|nr:MAG: hypothetical protein FRX48_07906 [Lasallia pustulata]